MRGKFNGAKHVTEAWDILMDMVGERAIRCVVVAESAVDFMEVRMPE